MKYTKISVIVGIMIMLSSCSKMNELELTEYRAKLIVERILICKAHNLAYGWNDSEPWNVQCIPYSGNGAPVPIK